MVKRGIKALYVTFSGIPVGPNSGVIRTQVYDLLKGISKNCPVPIYIRWVCFVQKSKFKRNIREFKKLISDIYDLNIDIKIVTMRTRLQFYKFLKGILFLLKEYLRFLPDIIHVRSYPPIFFALIIKFIFGHRVKVICDPRGVYPEENKQTYGRGRRSLKYRLQKFIEAWSLKKSNVIICMSKTLEEHYRCIYNRGNYSFIPPCVDFQRFNLNNQLKKNIRDKYNLPPYGLILLHSGKFDYPWSVSVVLGEIFKIIYKSRPETYLMVLSNSNKTKIRDILLRYGIEQKCLRIFSPNYNDIPILTNAADIGLLAREESIINRVAFPIKVLDYLAAGLPVITTKANLFISQIVEEEKIGLVFESHDNDFLQKLDKLLDTTTKIRCINFAKNHDIKEISKKYLDIYFKTVGYYD